MKYMGSKRWMLNNGLGDILHNVAKGRSRFVDLFCGAGSVSWFAAQELNMPVLAVDLQSFATVLTGAVIERTLPVDADEMWSTWEPKIVRKLEGSTAWPKAVQLDSGRFNTVTWSKRARELCAERKNRSGVIWASYGGYYFSPTQALTFDAMLQTLPRDQALRTVCLAAVIIAASQCAASPGHTAQPFKATPTAGRYLREAWLRKPAVYVKRALESLAPKHARIAGETRVDDALNVVGTLSPVDLVFIDPPYSGVHYSRFYHVLETIARGKCGPVEGVGRYPPPTERPASSFSRKSESQDALQSLLERLATRRCCVVFTFPASQCSNGLSGSLVEQTARQWFGVTKKVVKTRFSTLGGNNLHRSARQASEELILTMDPRTHR